MLVIEFVVIENFVEPRETGFPKWEYGCRVDSGKEGGPSERMCEEKWKESNGEDCESEGDEVDEGDGEEQGSDRGGKKEVRVRRSIGEMGENGKDGIVYVRATNVLRYYGHSGESLRRTRSP